MDLLFGGSEEAGRIRKSIHFLRYAKRASVRVGQPINLQEILDKHPEWTDERIARKLGRMMLVQLGREAMSIHGPPMKSPEQLQFEIMERRAFKAELKSYQESEGEKIEVTRRPLRCALYRRGHSRPSVQSSQPAPAHGAGLVHGM